jgi:hypothetical protein
MHGPEKNPLTRLRSRENNTLGLEEKRRKKNPANPPPPPLPTPPKKKIKNSQEEKQKTRKDREKEQPKKNNSNAAATKTSTTTTKRKEREGSKLVLRCAPRTTPMDSRRQSSARPADRIPAVSSYPPECSTSGQQPGNR